MANFMVHICKETGETKVSFFDWETLRLDFYMMDLWRPQSFLIFRESTVKEQKQFIKWFFEGYNTGNKTPPTMKTICQNAGFAKLLK